MFPFPLAPGARTPIPLIVVAALFFIVGWLVAQPAGAFEGFLPADATSDDSSGPAASDEIPETPTVKAARLNGHPIKLDGRLDDSGWSDARPMGGFRVWDPDRGAQASEETVFKVAYDEGAIYFGVACFEEDPSKISSRLSRRDHFNNSDIISIYIDPYLDRTTGYNFRVNPHGVQMDSYIFDDGNRDDDWDAVWQAETFRDDRGWYAEMRIPFSAIRFRPGEEMTWGLQVYRYMHSRGEDTAWHVWDRETAGFVSRFGQLQGICDVKAPCKVEIAPYFVQRTTNPSAVGADDELDHFQNFGADIKYGVTADLCLNATVQPDFGQVEADPSTLNLSAFETYFQEKRPFFIEGSRFFQHPHFNVFYSRRIGTGSENSRIRYAGKLTGKTGGSITIAALAATTDLTLDGQAHNPFKNGSRESQFFVTRFGKDFSGGNHQVHVMQTAVLNQGSREEFDDRGSREAYTTGVDFDLNLLDRAYSVEGSVVGSVIDPEPYEGETEAAAPNRYGTGGYVGLGRAAGKLRGELWGRWETDGLDLNDVGFLSAPDEVSSGLWMNYRYNRDGSDGLLTHANVGFDLHRGWMYAGRSGRHGTSGERVWEYGRGHPASGSIGLNSWMQFSNYWNMWMGANYHLEGSRRWETRGGPLISEPETWGGWWGGATDGRKDIRYELELNYFDDAAHNRSFHTSVGADLSQSSAINHSVYLSYNDRVDDTQYLETVDLGERPGGVGIGGYSYVFGDLHQKTARLTLRSNVLFARNKSLEIYAQPFITVGEYRRARELARPDSYDLITYSEDGFDFAENDFRYTALNINAVFRWEYRPGSTFYLVWTHGRDQFDQRGSMTDPVSFKPDLQLDDLFATEPEDVFLLKFSYWLPL